MERFKYAREVLKTKGNGLPEGDFIAEDYWINIPPYKSWKVSDGNPTALNYALRIALAGIPLDDRVVYGKIDGLGFLVHESELILPEE